MSRRVVLQLRFSRENGQSLPVAASRKQRGAGARVTLEVEPEALHAGSVFVLYRAGGAEVVVAGSVHRARVEAALQGLGEAGAAYRIAIVPVEDEGAAAFS
ncbi:MAG: hypothetical protein ACXWLM_00345 [Myxococcales bacterium]